MNRRVQDRGSPVVVLFDGVTQTTAIDSDAEEEADTFTVRCAPYANAAPVAAVTATLNYWLGDAMFTMPPLVVGQSGVELVVTARKVQLNLQGALHNGTNNAPAQQTFSAGMSRGAINRGPRASGGGWITKPAGAGDGSSGMWQLTQSAGFLYAAQVNVTAFTNGIAGLYALLFDSLAAPTNGVSYPVAGGRSALMSPGAPSDDFGGEFTPVKFQNGLWVALSLTADVYEAPPVANYLTFDAFVGAL